MFAPEGGVRYTGAAEVRARAGAGDPRTTDRRTTWSRGEGAFAAVVILWLDGGAAHQSLMGTKVCAFRRVVIAGVEAVGSGRLGGV